MKLFNILIVKFQKISLSLSEKIFYIYLSKFINFFYKFRYLQYIGNPQRSKIFEIDNRQFANLGALSKYATTQYNKTCHIVATGPSLSINTLRILKTKFTIGVNGIVFAEKICNFEPKILVTTNPLFVKNNSKEIKNCKSLKFLSIRSQQYININKLKNFYLTKNKFGFGYNLNLKSEYYHEGWNVTYLALQIAVALGFKNIIIHGFDNYYKLPDNLKHKSNKKIVIKNNEILKNHFIKNYLRHKHEYHLPYLRHSVYYFYLISKILKKNAIRCKIN